MFNLENPTWVYKPGFDFKTCEISRVEEHHLRLVRMDGLSVGSSTPARGPQDGPNVHHGLSLMSQSLIFCIRPGFMDETVFVLYVFG
jgi:hypothetical protein